MKYSVKKKLHVDFSVFEQNKLPARSYFIPFSDENALNKSNYKNERYTSDRIIMLSGKWDFAYFDRLSFVPEPFNTDTTVFNKIEVPSTWQRTGYDQIAYINTRYAFPKNPPFIPEDIPVGICRKTIDVKQPSANMTITFLGVAGALSVYINGKFTGYSEGSHNTAEFNITPYIKEGENEVLAVVYKWSNGSYLECQDMFRENGIFRDVYITLQKDSRIFDYLIRPYADDKGYYCLKISVSGSFSEKSSIDIYAENCGEILFTTSLLPKTETVIRDLKVKEWSAETPEVYKVVLILKNEDRVIETVRTYIGFKNIKIDGEVFLFNGKAIKIKGVNHHDTHMTKGYAMSLNDLEKDIVLMKEYNCNAVRTSHYPPDPVFLTMCDIYGLYAIDEADIETHGFYSIPGTFRPGRLSNDPAWASHYLDRVKRMYERDKNHPCITMWSLGNESGGYKCQDACYSFLKNVNPEIPVHYEGVIFSRRWAYDVVSRMYGTPGLMRKILAGNAGKRYKGRPFFQCEYAHAMGNGPGGLEEYWQLFYSSKQFMGGCIWEWADHSVYDENAKYKWTYGGDHNEPIHDGNFCVDGLFYPDRRPSSGALEMKAVYRPIRAKYCGDGIFELKNTRSFADSSDISIDFKILKNGKIEETGNACVVIPAAGSKKILIKSTLLNQKQNDIFVNFIYTDKASKTEIAKEQIIICKSEIKKADISQSCADISVTGNIICVSFKGGRALFDKERGLISYIKNKKEFLNINPIDGLSGFVPHIFRGRLDNDSVIGILWDIIGLKEAKVKLILCKVKTENGVKYISTVYDFVTRGIFALAKAQLNYYFDENGKITIKAELKKICPLTAQLPRFGVHAELAPDFENVTYYGRGPKENYSDFKEHSPIGIYSTTVSKMAHKYIKPQDSGNRGEVLWCSLDNGKNSLHFKASEKRFNFNANHFTLNQLIKANHIEDLPDRKTTFAAIDGFVRGTGSASCGPLPPKAHRVKFGYTSPLSYTFTAETE